MLGLAGVDCGAIETAPAVTGAIEREYGAVKRLVEPGFRVPLGVVEIRDPRENALGARSGALGDRGIGQLLALRLAEWERPILFVEIEDLR